MSAMNSKTALKKDIKFIRTHCRSRVGQLDSLVSIVEGRCLWHVSVWAPLCKRLGFVNVWTPLSKWWHLWQYQHLEESLDK